MKKVLIVVDMQNDFIDGALSNPSAQEIVNDIAEYVKNFEGLIVFTRDTHEDNYLDTREGRRLPIPHCIALSSGWEINKKIYGAAEQNEKAHVIVVNKTTFSAGTNLHVAIKTVYDFPDEIQLCGTCTDICVVSNALSIVGSFNDANIVVIENLCAGLTKEKHNAALEVMRSCQIEIVQHLAELRNFIYSWAERYGYLDKYNSLSKYTAHDIGYDLKSDIESSKFNESENDNYDIWFDEFLEESIIPILVSLGATLNN